MQKSRDLDRRPPPVRPHPDDHVSPPQSSPQQTESQTTQGATSVRLTRKFADMIDGVDLTDAKVGDELSLSPHDADVLIAEGWAERTGHPRRRAEDLRSDAAERPAPRPSRS